ncbi:hypothetical protein [Sphingobacterium paludis]|uniref:Uncharacterized protein n=1 Tax=Sphingobacterium paludis TaxID=1476465 RepID=A0A4R7D1W6_9SPHI|nr:hypothetical protein [Sphingobacterium paludis]TDS14740.1 hypothetical protein B0I21_103239 [Sphingobacterium paludis]
MKQHLQLTISGKDGTQSWYTAEVTKGTEFLSVLLTGYQGFEEKFLVRKEDDRYKVIALDKQTIMEPKGELHQKLETIGRRFLS